MSQFTLIDIWFCLLLVLYEVTGFFPDNFTTLPEETNVIAYPEVAITLLQPMGFKLFMKGQKLQSVEYHINFYKAFDKTFPGDINGFDTNVDSETWTYENRKVLLNVTGYLYWYFVAQPMHSSPYQAEYYNKVSRSSNGTLCLREHVARQGNLIPGKWYEKSWFENATHVHFLKYEVKK